MKPKFKIDIGWREYEVFRIEKCGPFNLFSTYTKIVSFETERECLDWIEKNKNFPQYHGWTKD